MTISNLNYNLLAIMYEQAKAWGVDGMNFNHLWMQTDEMLASQKQQFPDFDAGGVAWEVDPEAIDVEVLADQLEVVRRRNRLETMLITELPQLNREQIRIWYRQTAEFVKYQSTRCAWTRMKIWPDGRIKPCREWVVGNVAEQSLAEIWQGQAFQGFRTLLAEHGTIPLCSRCCYMTHR